jgi:hypothetical protein
MGGKRPTGRPQPRWRLKPRLRACGHQVRLRGLPSRVGEAWASGRSGCADAPAPEWARRGRGGWPPGRRRYQRRLCCWLAHSWARRYRRVEVIFWAIVLDRSSERCYALRVGLLFLCEVLVRRTEKCIDADGMARWWYKHRRATRPKPGPARIETGWYCTPLCLSTPQRLSPGVAGRPSADSPTSNAAMRCQARAVSRASSATARERSKVDVCLWRKAG